MCTVEFQANQEISFLQIVMPESLQLLFGVKIVAATSVDLRGSRGSSKCVVSLYGFCCEELQRQQVVLGQEEQAAASFKAIVVREH